jgi:hypothetical protein
VDGNGVTRREFEELRQDVRDLRAELRRIDREGSAATGRLVDRVIVLSKALDDLKDEDVADLKDFNKWFVRGLIASVLLAVVVAFVLQGGAGN